MSLADSMRPSKTGIVLYDPAELPHDEYVYHGLTSSGRTVDTVDTIDRRAIPMLSSSPGVLSADQHRARRFTHKAPSHQSHAATSDVRAIRPGGPVDLFSRDCIGLLLDWGIVGVLQSTLNTLVLIMVQSYLGSTPFQVNVASCLTRLPWQFHFAAGFVSDCFPIQRRRRKPYVVIGWSLFAVFMFAIATVEFPRPHARKPGEVPDTRGQGIVVGLVLSQLVNVLVIVSLEGFMVECAQREGELVRGRTQCLCIMSRYAGQFLGDLSLALAFNSAEFGGTFAASVPIRVVCVALGIVALAGVVITLYLLREDKMTKTTQRLSSQVRTIWSMMQQQATWQVTIIGLLLILATTYDVQEMPTIYTQWLHTTRIEKNLSKAFEWVSYIAAAAVYMKLVPHTNWRTTMVVCILCTLVVSVPVDMIVTFDVWRNKPLFFTKRHVAMFLDTMLFVLRAVMIVEVAQPGYEAVSYGILMTVFKLGISTMTITQNVLATTFRSSDTNLKADTPDVRCHVANEFLAKYILLVVALAVVFPLMPRQRRHLQEIRQRSIQSLIIPIALAVVLLVLFCLSLSSLLLAMDEKTSCLVIAGGRGCSK